MGHEFAFFHFRCFPNLFFQTGTIYHFAFQSTNILARCSTHPKHSFGTFRMFRGISGFMSHEKKTEKYHLRPKSEEESNLASEFKTHPFSSLAPSALHFTTIYVRPQLGLDHFRSGECRPSGGTPPGGPAGARRGRKGTQERERERESKRYRVQRVRRGEITSLPGNRETRRRSVACQDELSASERRDGQDRHTYKWFFASRVVTGVGFCPTHLIAA